LNSGPHGKETAKNEIWLWGEKTAVEEGPKAFSLSKKIPRSESCQLQEKYNRNPKRLAKKAGERVVMS